MSEGLGTSLRIPTSTPQYPLGQDFHYLDSSLVTLPGEGESYPCVVGAQIWRYINNTSEDIIEIGQVVGPNGVPGANGLLTLGNVGAIPALSPAVMSVGVAQFPIPVGFCGFVLRSGLGQVLADEDGITAGTHIAVGAHTPGSADNADVAQRIIGLALDSADEGELAPCILKIA